MMKDKLPCEIVLDLLPSYVDGLTREATNEALEEHLQTCQSCNQSFENMKQPEAVEPTVEEKQEIDFLKKAKKKHIGIIVSSIAIAIVVGVILFFVNAFFGNPVSHILAINASKEYVEEEYGDLDVDIVRVGYDFKFTRYYAVVQSDSSIDTHFTVYMSMTGEVEYDTYDSVTGGWNTFHRLDQEYRELVDTVLEEPDLPFQSNITFGSLKMNEIEVGGYAPVQYGILVSELELDKNYDIKQLGSEAGQITFYAEDEEVTVEKAAEYIILIKQELDEAGIPFYAIDFTLEKPTREDYEYNQDDPVIYVSHFLYSDIYEEGMVERVQKAYEDLDAYYKKMDSMRKDY